MVTLARWRSSAIGAGAGVFSDGVQGKFATGNATLTFSVPADAPDQLWYQCQFHDYMGGRLNIVAGTHGEDGARAQTFAISGAAPNPFRKGTILLVDLPVPATVSVTLYDLLGRAVLRLAPAMLQAGDQIPIQIPALRACRPAAEYGPERGEHAQSSSRHGQDGCSSP